MARGAKRQHKIRFSHVISRMCVCWSVCVCAGRNCIQHATHQMSNFQNGNCLKTKTFQKFALNKTQYILAAEKGQKPFVSGCVIERKNILGPELSVT